MSENRGGGGEEEGVGQGGGGGRRSMYRPATNLRYTDP